LKVGELRALPGGAIVADGDRLGVRFVKTGADTWHGPTSGDFTSLALVVRFARLQVVSPCEN
jgi:hypothetical protein